MKEKIKKWIDKYQNEIIYFGYIGFVIVLLIIVIIAFVGRFISIINSDIPTWLKWQLLTR